MHEYFTTFFDQEPATDPYLAIKAEYERATAAFDKAIDNVEMLTPVWDIALADRAKAENVWLHAAAAWFQAQSDRARGL